jgi:hypothetical protein
MAEILHNVKLHTLETANVSVQQAPLYLSNTGNVTLTVSTHSGRVLAVRNQSANNHAYILPTPKRGGDDYQFVYAGAGSMTTNLVIRMPHTSAGDSVSDTTTKFRGSVTMVETRSGFSNLVVFANNSNHSNINIVQPGAMNLRFVSANTSTSNPSYIVSGTVTATGQGNGLFFSDL